MTVGEVVRTFNARPAGRNRWRARCPVHRSKGLTLAIYAGDKATIVHCFAGCELNDILGAVGLRMRDLFYHQRDLASEALQRNLNRERQQRQSDLKIGEWIMRFAESGYTLEDHDRDVTAICAAAIVLSHKMVPHWERILKVHMERILAAEHCRLNRMLPETKQFERDIEAAYR